MQSRPGLRLAILLAKEPGCDGGECRPQNPHFRSQNTNLMLEGSMEVHDTGRFAWLVGTATDLSELEENLNHLSEQGFGVHRILSATLQTEQSTFVIVGRRSI